MLPLPILPRGAVSDPRSGAAWPRSPSPLSSWRFLFALSISFHQIRWRSARSNGDPFCFVALLFTSAPWPTPVAARSSQVFFDRSESFLLSTASQELARAGFLFSACPTTLAQWILLCCDEPPLSASIEVRARGSARPPPSPAYIDPTRPSQPTLLPWLNGSDLSSAVPSFFFLPLATARNDFFLDWSVIRSLHLRPFLPPNLLFRARLFFPLPLSCPRRIELLRIFPRLHEGEF